MKVILYYNKSDDRVLNKDLTTIIIMEGQLVGETTVTDPSITVDIDQDRIDMSLVNYFEIPEFNRKYFMKNPAIFINGVWQITGHCDILTSAKEYLVVKSGYVERQENASTMVADDMCKTYNNPIITTKSFPNGFSDNNYVLTIVSAAPDVYDT